METMTLQECYRQARQAIDSGESGKAIALMEHALEHYPQAIEAHNVLGVALTSAGRLEEAIASFDRVLEMEPLHSGARSGKGFACRDLGRTAEATRELELALEIDPGIENVRDELVNLYVRNPESESTAVRLNRIGLAGLYAKGNLLVQAATEYRSILESEPNRVDVKLALAKTLWSEGKRDEAAGICQSILVDNPRCFRAKLIVAGLYLRGDREEEGRALLQRIQEQDPGGELARRFIAMAGVPDDWLPLSTEEPILPVFAEYAEASIGRDAVAPAQEDGYGASGELAPKAWESPWAESVGEETEELRADEGAGEEEPQLGVAADSATQAQPNQEVEAYLAAEMVDLSPDLKPFSLDEIVTEPADQAPEVSESSSTGMDAGLPEGVEPVADREQSAEEDLAVPETELPVLSAEEIRSFNDVDLAEVLPSELEGEAESGAGLVQTGLAGLEKPESDLIEAEAAPVSPPLGLDEAELLGAKEDEEGWGEFATGEAAANPTGSTIAADKTSESVIEEEAETGSTIAAASEQVPDEAAVPTAEPVRVEKVPEEPARLVAAEAHRRAGDYGRALGEYRALMKEQPSLLPSVVKGLHVLLADQPDSQAAHRLLGDAYLKQGLYQKAMSEFRWVLTKSDRQK